MGAPQIIGLSLLGFVLLVSLLYLFVLLLPRAKRPKNAALLCDYAHRGLHGGEIPENSLAAFERACEAGVGIELDVQLSRDGVVMVFHDYTLVRMTGKEGKLSDLTADELSSLTLANSGETIPTFAEVLALVDGRVPILVELKGESVDTSLCERVAAHLSAYNGAYCLESFNPLLIGHIKKYLPDAFRGLLYTNVCREKKSRSALNVTLTCMALNFLAKPNFIAYNQQDRNALPVRITTRLFRAPRFVWTIRSAEALQTAHEKGECPIFEGFER